MSNTETSSTPIPQPRPLTYEERQRLIYAPLPLPRIEGTRHGHASGHKRHDLSELEEDQGVW